jgi:hypothetical protein
MGYGHFELFVYTPSRKRACTGSSQDRRNHENTKANGALGSRRDVNLEQNVAGPQSTNFIEVSGMGSWHGSPYNISTYLSRFPVMGPFVQVFVYNRAPTKRLVSVWGYLVS